LVLVGTGYLLLALLKNWVARYVAVFLIACTNAAVMPFLAHRTATVSGSTATALATGVTIAISNCGGISAPFLFPSTDGPNYPMGNVSYLHFFTDGTAELIHPCSGPFSACYVRPSYSLSILASDWAQALSTATLLLVQLNNLQHALTWRVSCPTRQEILGNS
jgi:hypothetical protein